MNACLHNILCSKTCLRVVNVNRGILFKFIIRFIMNLLLPRHLCFIDVIKFFAMTQKKKNVNKGNFAARFFSIFFFIFSASNFGSGSL